MKASSRPIGPIIKLLAVIVAGIYPATARSAGISLYETGAPDLGTAGAGRAALAADASTAGANPAGMTLLDSSQLLVAAGAMLPAINFHVGPHTTTAGNGGGNAGVFLPLGSGFFVCKFSARLWLGLAAGSNFGLAVDYGKQWAGRYYLTRGSLLTGQATPSIAYRVNDCLSVGAGFTIVVGRLYNQVKVNNALRRVPDGRLSFESWDVEAGGNVGFLLQPISKLRIGLTYQSPIDFTFGFNPHTSGPWPGPPGGTEKKWAAWYEGQPRSDRATTDDGECVVPVHTRPGCDGRSRMAELVGVRTNDTGNRCHHSKESRS